jgi:pectate lyase
MTKFKYTLFSIILLLFIIKSHAATYEAEDANILYKAIIEYEHSGFSGSGYVNFDNEPGGYIEWLIPMADKAEQSITIYYAHGGSDTREMKIEVDSLIIDSAKIFPATGAWTTWDSVTVTASLDSGINKFRLTALSSEGGPNIDRIEVTGEPGINKYTLTILGSGGKVTLNPLGGLYDEGTNVALTAIPAEDFSFYSWSGDLNSTENPTTITMDSNKEIQVLFRNEFDTLITDFENEPVGFATLDGGTTGGAGGDTITVTGAQQLYDILKPRENKITDPLVIFVDGTLTGLDDMLDIKRTGNISLIGLGADAGLLGFGIKIVEGHNVIVQNLTFADCHVEEKDGLTIDNSNNIWIDHCTFTDSPAYDPGGSNHDGLLDVKKGSYNVTISHNYYTNHRKTALFGHSVSETGDVNMKATYYCNWFDGTQSRHPRTRYGKVHLLNNLYTDIGGYGVGVTCGAQVQLEGNYFENTDIPALISQVNDPGETLSGDPEGYLKSVSNFIYNSGTIVENLNRYDFNPHDYYEYSVYDSQKVKAIVKMTAGAGKLNITSVAKEKNTLPNGIDLLGNYPNPFNPTTKIIYAVDTFSHIKLNVYDIHGRKIIMLVDEYKSAGYYDAVFDGGYLVSGIYFYQLSCGLKRLTGKMMLIK